VRLLFDADVAPAVQVAPSLQVVDREHTNDGRLFLTLRVDHALEVLPWVLSWGRHVRVVKPRRLRRRLATEARAVASQYRDAPTLLD
jgi:predicted DNA-binding transcriptional regulator YafY